MCICGLNKGRNLHVKVLLYNFALFMMHMIILKTWVLSQVCQTSLPGNDHSFPSTIKSSSLAPVSWFMFYSIIHMHYFYIDCFLQDACFPTLNHTFDWIVTKIEWIKMPAINQLLDSLRGITCTSHFTELMVLSASPVSRFQLFGFFFCYLSFLLLQLLFVPYFSEAFFFFLLSWNISILFFFFPLKFLTQMWLQQHKLLKAASYKFLLT